MNSDISRRPSRPARRIGARGRWRSGGGERHRVTGRALGVNADGGRGRDQDVCFSGLALHSSNVRPESLTPAASTLCTVELLSHEA